MSRYRTLILSHLFHPYGLQACCTTAWRIKDLMSVLAKTKLDYLMILFRYTISVKPVTIIRISY